MLHVLPPHRPRSSDQLHELSDNLLRDGCTDARQLAMETSRRVEEGITLHSEYRIALHNAPEWRATQIIREDFS